MEPRGLCPGHGDGEGPAQAAVGAGAWGNPGDGHPELLLRVSGITGAEERGWAGYVWEE